MAMLKDIGGLLALTARLLARFWPQLMIIGALGFVARALLLEAAVGVGLRAPLGGMVTLSFVVLVKLLVVIGMFATLSPGLPALAALRGAAPATAAPAPEGRAANRLLLITAAAILPFFAYYAAWGFLADAVREYSRLALDRVAFGERVEIFELLRSRSLIAAIAACWVVRWLAKRANSRRPSPWLRLLIVAADASWIFIGLYALDKWKDDLIGWIGAGALLQGVEASLAGFTLEAHAAGGDVPVEFRQPNVLIRLQDLFFYALLPLIWLVMAAIVYGYDLSAKPAAPPPPSRATTFRKWLHDFLAHFLGGYRSRYKPVWTCLSRVLGAGLGALLAFIVLYRAVGWLTAWTWYGTTHFLGPYTFETWQRIGDILGVLVGSPVELDGGILFDPVRIALLAAMLEFAVSRKDEQGTPIGGAAPAGPSSRVTE